MNRRLLGVFVFALAVASVTSFAVYRLIVTHVQSPAAPAVAPTKLVVASHDLQVGALIHDSDLQEVAWSGAVPGHALRAANNWQAAA